MFIYRKQVVPTDVDRLDVTMGTRSTWLTVRPAPPVVAGLSRIVAAPDGSVFNGYARTRSELYVISGLK